MKKWVGLLLPLLSILILIFFLGPFRGLHQGVHEDKREEKPWISLTQRMEKEEEKGELDSYSISLLKQIKEKVDGWLKSLNERIEKEDVTHFEVRFLEILRNMLEWVKEKIDAELETSKGKIPKKRERGGFMQETHLIVFPLYGLG